MQAWGTIAGAFFAACAAVAAFLVLLHEIKLRRRDQEDLIASTARLILVTIDQPEGQPPLRENVENVIDGMITSVKLQMNNFSRFPIIDVAVTAERLDNGQRYATWSTDLLNPGESRLAIRPWIFKPPLKWPSALDPPNLIRTKITFTDDKGLRWMRTDHEQPVRLLSSAPSFIDPHDRPIRKYDATQGTDLAVTSAIDANIQATDPDKRKATDRSLGTLSKSAGGSLVDGEDQRDTDAGDHRGQGG